VEVGYISALRNASGGGEVPVFTKSEASALVYTMEECVGFRVDPPEVYTSIHSCTQVTFMKQS